MPIDPEPSAVPPPPAPCPRCGRPLGGSGPAGLCAACLFDTATLELDLPSADQGRLEDAPGSARGSRRIGDYELMEEIARGGMGVVYRARQVSLNRVVAVKMILRGSFASGAALARFRQEAEAAARLRHPHIVTIHEVAEHEGQPFFSMDYIEGQSLAAVLRPGPLPAARAAQLGEAIARAIHHAHEAGVLHRDLKPGNILVDPDGMPHVTDFGLAKRLDPEAGGGSGSDLTLTDQVLGTPSYMPPEQASGRRDAVGPGADVYGIGAILYHCLAGRPPFVGPDPHTTIRQVLEAEAVAPRVLNPATPRDLETIILKCLEKDPARRYPDALSLAEDLARFQRHEPILAAPPSAIYRAGKFVRRHRSAVAAAAVILLALSVATIVSTGYALRAIRAQTELRQRLAQSYVQKGMDLVDQGEDAKGLLWLTEALQLEQLDPVRSDAHRHRIAAVLEQIPPLLQIWTHPGKIEVARFSPDGRRVVLASEEGGARVWDVATGKPAGPPLASTNGVVLAAFAPSSDRLVTGETDHSVRIWDLQTGQMIAPPLPHRSPIYHVEFTPDGRSVVAGAIDGSIRLWNATTGAPESPAMKHPGNLTRARLSPDGRKLATAGADNTACLWDIATGERLFPPLEHLGWVMEVEFSPDGSQLLTASIDGAARLWDAGSGRLIHDTMRHDGPVKGARFSATGRLIATRGLADNATRFWHAANGREAARPLPQGGSVSAIAFSPDGRLLATGGADSTVRLWDASYGEPLRVRFQHNATVSEVAFSPDARLLLTASHDGAARLWDLSRFNLSHGLLAHTQSLNRVTLSPRGDRLATAGKRSAQVWDLATEQGVGQPILHGQAVYAASFSPDGENLLTGGFGGHVRLSNIRTGLSLVPGLSHPTNVAIAAFSPDGSHLLTADDAGTAVLREAGTGKERHRLHHGRRIHDAAFSPSGDRVVTAGSERNARVWDVASGRMLLATPAHEQVVYGVAFSPDGTRLVTASYDRSARIWDATSGAPIGAAMRHNGEIKFAAFSADGRRVVTSGYDSTARIWNAATGEPVTGPLIHAAAVNRAAFSPDGRWLVTAGQDGSARVWDAVSGERMTPPLSHAHSVNEALFSTDQRTIVSASEDGQVRLWRWKLSHETPEALVRLAQLLSGQALEASGAPAPLGPTELARRQAAERDRFPSILTDIPGTAERWHRRQVTLAQVFVPSRSIKVAMRSPYFADTWEIAALPERSLSLRLHLEQLMALHPGEASLRDAHARAIAEAETLARELASPSSTEPAAAPTGSAEPAPSRPARSAEAGTSSATVETLARARELIAAGQASAAEALLQAALSAPSAPATNSTGWSTLAAALGESRLHQKRFGPAEAILRPALAISEQLQPQLSPTFSIQGLLGWALLGQNRLAEAQPLLEQCHAGLAKRQSERPTPARALLLRETAARLAQLHEAAGRTAEAAAWMKKAQ